MIAIILTAGYGNRMRPLTDGCHKTLLPVAGKQILARIVDGLKENGITRYVFVTGYRSAEVETFLVNRYSDLSFTFVHNERYRETNNIYSMALAFEQVPIDEDILLIESDLIYDPRIITRIIASKHENVALVDHFRTGMDGTVVSVEGGVIVHVIPTHQQGPKFDFTDKYKTLNIYKFSNKFCNDTFKKLLIYYARTIDSNCYYELVLGMLIYMQRETIHAEVVEGEPWAEVDDPNDLRTAEFTFSPDSRFSTADRSFGGFWNYDILDFGFIRNMYFPTPNIFSEIRNSLESLLQSYCSKHDILREKLGYLCLADPSRLNVLAGGSQIYPILGSFIAGRRIHIPQPTFGEYARFSQNAVYYNDSFSDGLHRLETTLSPHDVVVIVNPNNPTGTHVASSRIQSLVRRKTEVLFVVDESFIDFAEGPSLQSLVASAPPENLIIIKSLSKALGVPGVRLGYTYSANDTFNKHARGLIPIWQLGSVAEFLLEICLKHRRELAESFEKTKHDRTEFAGLLERTDAVLRVFPSGGNFILAQMRAAPQETAYLAQRLASEHAIYVKDASNKFCDGAGYFRIAVRLPHENASFIRALNVCFAGH
jgi:histidinol-phosphate/aromatic aminotransferase/cobyric acid decarboxylase-like protein/choline kinase